MAIVIFIADVAKTAAHTISAGSNTTSCVAIVYKSDHDSSISFGN